MLCLLYVLYCPLSWLGIDFHNFSIRCGCIFVHSTFTGISLLQLECMLSLSLSLLLSLSITSALHSSALLSTLFTIVCVEVPLLLSENEFLFQNILATCRCRFLILLVSLLQIIFSIAEIIFFF